MRGVIYIIWVYYITKIALKQVNTVDIILKVRTTKAVATWFNKVLLIKGARNGRSRYW